MKAQKVISKENTTEQFHLSSSFLCNQWHILRSFCPEVYLKIQQKHQKNTILTITSYLINKYYLFQSCCWRQCLTLNQHKPVLQQLKSTKKQIPSHCHSFYCQILYNFILPVTTLWHVQHPHNPLVCSGASGKKKEKMSNKVIVLILCIMMLTNYTCPSSMCNELGA